MRTKLLALREGRIPLDEEFTSMLEDNSISVAPDPEEPGLLEQEKNEEDEEDDDDDEVEGEIVEDDNTLDAHVDELMVNLMQQSAEHLSLSIKCFAIDDSFRSGKFSGKIGAEIR